MPRKTLTYISLFSCAGVGCYGFSKEGFQCIATNEIIARRLEIQKYNHKCSRQEGYIHGDITLPETKEKILNEIDWWRQNRRITDVDVVIATPPCQGMSIFNHKKNDDDINRNSLVIESLRLVKSIQPKFFVFENVPAFMDTACKIDDHDICSIREAHERILGNDYLYYADIVNFKYYGSNSSRTRTLVIGVRKNLAQFISPIELFPDRQDVKTLRQVIGDLPSLTEMGSICDQDILHSFRPYPEYMRMWISGLKEGESAFDNDDPIKRPYKIDKNGNRVENANKTGDKYKRQYWDKCAPSVHTRNDQLASQNTIHPSDDRVFSVRELMRMMTIPDDFCWTSIDFSKLNGMPVEKKKSFLKKEETNIRQCIGEAVPTAIFRTIANKMADFLIRKHYSDAYIRTIISKHSLNNPEILLDYIKQHGDPTRAEKNLSISTLARITELANNARVENAAYYTGKDTLTEVFQHLPSIEKEEISILEPAVGTGNFIPFLIKKYGYADHVIIDIIDIDETALEACKQLISIQKLPGNVQINIYREDFITKDFGDKKYDLIIGNPPYLKLSKKDSRFRDYQSATGNIEANNLAAFFVEKALTIGRFVAFILPKNFMCNAEYRLTRECVSKKRVETIIDFGEYGFRGVNIETIFLIINTERRAGKTLVKSLPKQFSVLQKQRYITDSSMPNWIIYRNAEFDRILSSKKFGVFSVFRDRQITKGVSKNEGDIWVIKSRNIPREGGRIEHSDDYDLYVSNDDVKETEVYKYLDRTDVYLVPNMTYYPRMIQKPKGVLANGSVAILLPHQGIKITEEDVKYIASSEYEQFYRIARNHATRSLNIDSTSIYYFCISKSDE